MRIVFAASVLAASLLLAACGGSESSTAEPATTTASTTTRPVVTTTKAPTVYDTWAAAYKPYATSPGDVSKQVFEFQSSLCTTLRNGGQPATTTFPAQSPAQVLREGWGVGDTDPTSSPNFKIKGEVAEKVIIPIICPDQTAVIADAKAGNFTRALRTAFNDGKYLVGEDFAPGTYAINERVEDCYWERSDAQGNIIENNLISIAPSVTVTIAPTDTGFTSSRCGFWTKVG